MPDTHGRGERVDRVSNSVHSGRGDEGAEFTSTFVPGNGDYTKRAIVEVGPAASTAFTKYLLACPFRCLNPGMASQGGTSDGSFSNFQH